MKHFSAVSEMKSWRKSIEPNKVGFVPTMGALHQGHISLIQEAKRQCDRVIVSVFVNPTQFDDPKDFDKYPNQMKADLEILRQLEVDAVFTPKPGDMYPDDYRYKVTESELSRELCGAHRPGHFDGVLTVVLKLLLITEPEVAFFGEKDFQQYLLVRDMAHAFFLKTQIRSLPTVREPDGLAMSSRNVRLKDDERAKAPILFETLRRAQSAADAKEQLLAAGFEIDYVVDLKNRRFAAVRLGDVRLIDNVAL